MRRKLLLQVQDVFRNIFDNENLEITEDTVPEDIEEWDSIGHVYLITEMEDIFQIDLSEDVNELVSVASILDIVMRRKGL